MFRIFRELTNNAEENIAIEIIKSLADYRVELKIYDHKKLLNNLISIIAQTINSNGYNNLKWKEQDEMTSIIIKAMKVLAKNSLNTAPSYCYNTSWTSDDKKDYVIRYNGEFRGATNIYEVKGLEILTREDEGWNYYNELNELKFPDVFFDTKIQHILQTTIFNAIKNTKYNTLFFKGGHEKCYETA